MRLVVFDCDGTLVDSQHVIVAAMTEAFESAGRTPPPRAAILSIVGLSLPVAILRLMPEADPREVAAVGERYKAAFGRLRQDPQHAEPLYPGALETLRSLHARPDVVLGVATGKSRRGVAAVIERFGLDGLFMTIQTADTNASKPDPEMLHAAMREAGAMPGETVMIGDTTFDIEMAVAAGAASIGVGWGYHPVSALRAAGAGILVESYAEVLAAIDRVAAPRKAAS